MNVLLYRVGRNLNRVYRTAEAFGVEKLFLLDCAGELRGNLFRALNRIQIEHVTTFPVTSVLALETYYVSSIYTVDWSSINTIIVGGETSGLPRGQRFEYEAKIPLCGAVSGLTVEAALAIALYEWRKHLDLSQ